MPFKAQAAVRENQIPRVDNIVLEIDGLEDMGNGRFLLKDVPITMVDYPAIEKVLTDAGIDRNDAIHLTEEFSERVHMHGIAKIFARRAKRVG